MTTILYILAAIVIIILSLRFAMMIMVNRQKGKDAPSVDGKYGKLIRKGKKVMLYFYGPTCPPCIQMSPIVDAVAMKNENVFKIDVSQDFEVARKFGVMGTPAVIVVNHGKIAEYLVGMQSEISLSETLANA
jgi:thioredoxin 1